MGSSGEVTVRVEASPEQVYDLVADVTRMGEWSPECVKCVWQDGATAPAVGARFRGSNRQGLVRWSTVAEVTAAQRGREFAFTTKSGSRDMTRWRYVFTPAGDGTDATDVTESFEIAYEPRYVLIAEKLFMRGRDAQRIDGMRTTLERIKAAAEAAAHR